MTEQKSAWIIFQPDFNKMKKVIITTSWDDGHILDFKIADLLEKYGLRGTFYVSKNYFQENGLNNQEIIALSKKQEIGSHTINHPDLLKIPLAEAEQEIRESKKWLENVLGADIEMFCYPFGSYNRAMAELVRQAGFKGARTTGRFLINKPADFYQMDATIHAYPFPFRKTDSRHYYWGKLFQPYLSSREGIKKFHIPFFCLRGWKSFSKFMFDATMESGTMFHLFGHSWEVEKYQMWSELKDFFAYVSNRENCLYLTNGQVLKKYEDSDIIR